MIEVLHDSGAAIARFLALLPRATVVGVGLRLDPGFEWHEFMSARLPRLPA